jgi:transcriptional regulator with XRE-family HTH domain
VPRPPEFSTDVRLRLLAAILARGTTPEAAEEVASALGTSPQALARWIAGMNAPFERDRVKIERFLKRDEAKRASRAVAP